VFNSLTDCVEEHCIWEEELCKNKCYAFTTETDCEIKYCFWAEGNETADVNPKCVSQV
jgi:hypothetical protein